MKDVFPSYFAPLFSLHFSQENLLPLIAILFFTFILFSLAYLALLYFRFKKSLSQKSVILEIRPPSVSLQSAFSTKQLFTILHALNPNLTFVEKFLKVKKRISYEIVSTREEGIRYLLQVPQEDVLVISKNIRAYLSEVIIREVGDYIPSSFEELEKQAHSLIELKLTHSFVLPLQEQDTLTQYDPIAYLTAHMTKLEANELIAFQLVTTPIVPSSHSGILEYISFLHRSMNEGLEIESKINKNISANVVSSIFSLLFKIIYEVAKTIADWVMDFAMATRRPYYQSVHITYENPHISSRELTPRQKVVQDLAEKKITQNLFETSIRFFIVGSSKENIALRQKGLLSSLSTFDNPGFQSIKEKPTPFITLLLLRKLKYVELKHRLLSLSINSILSVSELSSIYHFPFTKTTQTEDLQAVKVSQLPPPLSFKKTSNNFDITFASNIHGEAKTPIGLTLEERRRHVYIIGATGTGKTTLLTRMIFADIENSKGLALIDPHGDLSKEILGIIPENRTKDIIYFNPYDIEYPIGLNFLEIPQGLSEVEKQREKDFIVSTIISIFHKLYAERYLGPKMEHVLRNTILTALELENPTLLTIYQLLTKSELRNQAKNLLTDELLKDFWKNEFEKLTVNQRTEMISPITNKLGTFLTAKIARNIITQKKSTLNFDEVMNSGKILVCDLSKGKIGEDVSSFLGSLIIAKLQLAAVRRVHEPEEERKDFFLYIDEFQNFATSSFANILSEARKYRFNAILAHQTVAQLDNLNLLKIILANVGSIIAFRTSNPSDEEAILPIFAPQVKQGALMNLESYRFYMKLQALAPQDTFTGELDKFMVKTQKETREKIITLSRKTYGVSIEKLNEDAAKKHTNKSANQDENNKQQEPVLTRLVTT